MSIERTKILFISGVEWVWVNSNEENGRPRAGQMKSACKSGPAVTFPGELLPSLRRPASAGKSIVSNNEKVKAFAAGTNAFPIRLSAFDTQGHSILEC